MKCSRKKQKEKTMTWTNLILEKVTPSKESNIDKRKDRGENL